MHRFRAIARRFTREDRGSVIVEAVIVLPLLLWAFVALFVYWDAFRSINVVQKASYTISDLISREVSVNTAYIEGMDDVMNFLLLRGQTARIRITSVEWSALNNRFQVRWSRSPGNALPPMTTILLQEVRHRIPEMSDGDTIILVETEVDYTPSFDVGLGDETFRQFIVTRPRFANRIELLV